jgi:hypothetical protein
MMVLKRHAISLSRGFAAIHNRPLWVERVSTAALLIPSVYTRPKATTRNVKRHYLQADVCRNAGFMVVKLMRCGIPVPALAKWSGL